LDVVQENGGLICTEFTVQLPIAQIDFLNHLLLIRRGRKLLMLLFNLLGLLSGVLFPDVLQELKNLFDGQSLSDFLQITAAVQKKFEILFGQTVAH
jgi:hypothetical protein